MGFKVTLLDYGSIRLCFQCALKILYRKVSQTLSNIGFSPLKLGIFIS